MALTLCPLSGCTAAPPPGPIPCGWAHLRPAPCVSGACLGPNEGAQPAGLPPGPHLAWHGERPGYLVKRAVLACSTADPGPHRHNCSLRFRFSDAPGTPFDGLYSSPDLGRRFEIARISARWDPQSCEVKWSFLPNHKRNLAFVFFWYRQLTKSLDEWLNARVFRQIGRFECGSQTKQPKVFENSVVKKR